MVKAHTPINWENEPSYNTPLNAANLNKMDSEIGILDDRIIEQDTIKLDKATANTMVKDISFNDNNGVFTVTRLNGSTFTIDTKLEKISINFDYNKETQRIEIILDDGTKQYIDISSLISPIDFVDSNTIGWEVTSDWKVKAKILDGSITENMLQPNYLAEIKVESAKAETNAIKSQSYAVGGTASRQNEDIDNARYYYEQAKLISESFSGALVPMGTVAFEDLPSLEDAVAGWMYNISNEFVTTDEFKEGAGHTIPLGANIFKTVDNFWDLLSGGSSDLIVDTVEGNNPTIDNSTDGNVTYLKNSGYIEQDGTPTSDAPIEIKGLGDSGTIEVKTCRKNVFDYTSIANRFSNNADGTEHTYSDGEFVITRVANNNSGVYSYANELNIFKGKKIRVTLDAKTNTDGMDIRVSLGGLSYVVKTITTSYARYSFDFDLSDVTNGYPFVIYGNSVAGNMYIKDIMFEDVTKSVSTGDTYEPYTGTQALIPISAPLYDGDYIEIYPDGSGQIVRTKGVKVFKGEELFYHEPSWVNSNAFFNSYALSDIKPVSGYATVANVKCSHLRVVTPNYLSDTESADGCIGIGGSKSIYISIPGITTQADLKTWLQANPITVVYELETPTTEPLTAEQVAEFMKLQTFKPVTNVIADGDVTVKYYCNNDSGETVARVSEKANNSVSKSSIANNLTTTTEGMVLDATQGKALNDKISKLLVSKETINIDSLSLSGGGHSTITSEEISKSGYTLVGANFFLRGSYAENIIASFTIGGSSTKIYNFAFYNPSDYNISAYGYVDLIYVANSL